MRWLNEKENLEKSQEKLIKQLLELSVRMGKGNQKITKEKEN